MKISRRGFLVGCSSAIAAMAGARINQVVFSGSETNPNEDILVLVFLRGGCDVLNLLPPIGGADRGYYEAARPQLRVPIAGEGSALNLNDQFGLHPGAGALYDIFQDQKLAIVMATGLQEDTRSHFDAMSYMELGTPGSKSSTTGWLTRHFQTASNLPTEMLMPALAVGNLQPTSLRGFTETTAMSSTGNFNLNNGPWAWRDENKTALQQLYNTGSSSLHLAGQETINFVDVFEQHNTGDYIPSNGAVYPDTSFGDRLQTVAQMIKMNIGLRVANVDLGGWDTHDNQGNGSTGYFNTRVSELSDGLSAFYTDLSGCSGINYASKTTVVVMSEFGRRLRENNDRGTDHGHGSMMMVMGGNVNGGIYGDWPGLENSQLYDNADLEVTTDYRQVLSEVLIKRLGNPNIDTIFPNFNEYSEMNIVKGGSVAPPPPAGPYRTFLPIIAKEEC